MSDAPTHGWLIHKAGRGWYRPNAHGYTSSTAEAGRFSRKDALEYSHPNGWSGPRDGITIKHESEICDREQLPRIQLYTEDQYAAENARLSASEPQCAVVKPLAWEPSINNRPWHSAKAPWGWYYAQWDDETDAWFASLEMGEIEGPIILPPSDVPTIDDAKAAAQADYEARILSAITLRTEAEAKAEGMRIGAAREKMRALAEWLNEDEDNGELLMASLDGDTIETLRAILAMIPDDTSAAIQVNK